jgi:hypothetical protein
MGDFLKDISWLGSKNEDSNLINESYFDEYVPIQKNSKIFKFILFSHKVEIQFTNLLKLIYNTSLLEFYFWLLGFFVFLASPKTMFLIIFLIGHPIKGVLGFRLLIHIPKTYSVIESVCANENIEEDKIIDTIQTQIRDSFIKELSEKKKIVFVYFITMIVCLVVDFIIFIIQISVFGKEKWILMQSCMIFIIILFIISDVVYFLWVVKLRFVLPYEIYHPVKKAIFGSFSDIKKLVYSKFKRQGGDSVIN